MSLERGGNTRSSLPHLCLLTAVNRRPGPRGREGADESCHVSTENDCMLSTVHTHVNMKDQCALCKVRARAVHWDIYVVYLHSNAWPSALDEQPPCGVLYVMKTCTCGRLHLCIYPLANKPP